MTFWIIEFDSSLAQQTQTAVQTLPIQGIETSVVPIEKVEHLLDQQISEEDFVLLATCGIEAPQIELLGRFKTHTEAKLVVVSNSKDHTSIMQAIRAGASDCLCSDDGLNAQLLDLHSRTEIERHRTTPDGRIMTILPSTNPTDASLLALNLAASVAQQTGTCGLVDLQLRGGDLATLLKTQPNITVLDLLQHEALDEAMIQQAMICHASGIQLLAGAPLFSDLRSIQPSECQKIFSYVRSNLQTTIVNCEDAVHAEQVHALEISDYVFLCVRPDILSLTRAQKLLEYLKENRVSADNIHIAAVETGTSGEIGRSAIQKLLKTENLHCIPADPVAVTMSINLGTPMVSEVPFSKASEAIAKLAKSLSPTSKHSTASNRRSRIFSLFENAALPLCNLRFSS